MNKKININFSYKIIIFSFVYGMSFYYLKVYSKQNSWIIAIISSIIGLFLIKMFNYIKHSYKNKSIYEINKIVLGNFLGNLTNIVFSIILSLLSIIMSWYLFTFLKTNFFEKTPILLIGIISFIPIFYISNKNSNVLIKSNIFYYFIIILLTIIALLFLSLQIEFSNLLPMNEVNNTNLIKAIFSFTTVTFLPTYVLNGLTNSKIKHFFKFSLTTILLIFSIVISTYLVLGNSIVEMVDYPQIFVLRKIGILANGTRIDSFIIIGWLLSIYSINSSIILYLRNYLKEEIKSYKNNYTYLVIIIILISSLYIFKNTSIGKLFILEKLPYILFFTLFLINFIIFIKIKMRHKVSHKY